MDSPNSGLSHLEKGLHTAVMTLLTLAVGWAADTLVSVRESISLLQERTARMSEHNAVELARLNRELDSLQGVLAEESVDLRPLRKELAALRREMREAQKEHDDQEE